MAGGEVGIWEDVSQINCMKVNLESCGSVACMGLSRGVTGIGLL